MRSDPVLVERILRNLVSNAVRYTDHGRVVVGCRRHAGALRICVHDTGIGIEPREQSLVFEEFYQVGNRERDRSKGLGLGLAIVERLARLLEAPLTLRFGAAHPRQVEVQQHETQADEFRSRPQGFLCATCAPHSRTTQQCAQPLHERISIERMVVDDERAGRHVALAARYLHGVQMTTAGRVRKTPTLVGKNERLVSART